MKWTRHVRPCKRVEYHCQSFGVFHSQTKAIIRWGGRTGMASTSCPSGIRHQRFTMPVLPTVFAITGKIAVQVLCALVWQVAGGHDDFQ